MYSVLLRVPKNSYSLCVARKSMRSMRSGSVYCADSKMPEGLKKPIHTATKEGKEKDPQSQQISWLSVKSNWPQAKSSV